MSSSLYIGLISGTSMDAVDCALIDAAGKRPKVLDACSEPWPVALRQTLMQLCHAPEVSLRELGSTDIAVGRFFASTVQALLARNSLAAGEIRAIGSHGQTVWHEPPQDARGLPFTLQLGDPNTIAELTGITTVADFRRRDMAAGGQGAPLVPALHREWFQSRSRDRIVLNLGGIANITWLPRSGSRVLGMDTGPASVLLDGWIQRHRDASFDAGGAWAASAQLDEDLLLLLLAEPYFVRPAPKSTGRELFNLAWLDAHLAQLGRPVPPENVQATLLALSVETISREVEQLSDGGDIIVCGGGAGNTAMLQLLAARLPDFEVQSSAAYGIDPDFVEAAAFAWFASRTLAGQPIAFEAFTGAAHAVIAGGIYTALAAPAAPKARPGKAAAGKAGTRQASAGKAPAKKAAAKKVATKKAAPKQAATRKAATKKAPAKKSPGRKAPTRKAPTSKAPTSKAPAKKAAVDKRSTKAPRRG